MQERKVAVVGMGGVFPTCDSLSQFEEKLYDNQSMIRTWPEALKYKKQIRSTVAGYITLEESGLEEVLLSTAVDYPEMYLDKLDRIPVANLVTADVGSIWSMLSTLDAIKMCGWSEEETTSTKTGVAIGSGAGGHNILRRSWDNFYNHGKKTRVLGAHGVDRAMVYRDAANVSCLIKNKGICEAVGSACASGLGNIGYAYRMIKYGIQDRMIAGGVEGTSLETFIGFDAMQVLSKKFDPEKSSRPLDKDRNGFVCSFGCGIVALEELESAKARGANILAVIDGYHNNSGGDGNMFFPSLDGQLRLWKGLKTDVPELKPDVVKIHGTSTPVGDTVELFSVIQSLGESGYHISAPKSSFGHMLGAAGAVEFIASVSMLQNQKVMPCLNSDNLNTELESFQKTPEWKGVNKPVSAYRDLIPQKSITKEINQIVALNYGFGGTNSIVSLSK